MNDIEWRKNLTRWTCGDLSAAAMLIDIWRIAELWDDLIDRDKPVKDEDINAAFYTAIISLPRNEFYQRHFLQINPLMESAIIDWHAANALEKNGSEVALRQAYVLRCSLVNLIVVAAKIIGGMDLARTVSGEVRMSGDTWTEYALKHRVQ
jgi:hypothetical protein